ncbi:CarD family transcriptional regulator [Butyricicoccus faecihominis]|uniref:CarD family transcriptional regulator n=1 Tax=Butyricicoccaceae TaxID=3085642 RepID=UPI00247ADF67|nr:MULTISPECIES: CarD family transcriptional regulator [Butyricicoccaceae]MCQ5131126.1 CarD family transcriptional regulator [Butyricicoccus faecihominis]WNX84108.1 CarD family transcriptional regulator [Agathobaculum sp. NTUH-O15-33]
MFQVGDFIVYGNNGACQVKAISTPGLDPETPDRRYYTIQPVCGTETIYIPVDSKVFMRPVMSKGEAEDLISRIPDISETPLETKDLHILTDSYRQVFLSHDCGQLVQLIKTTYRKNRTAVQNGKKPSEIDARFRKKAEELLHGELSVALGIPVENVPQYIESKIS